MSYITDTELRAMGVSEIDIDALDRTLTTQKPEGRDARPRAAVIVALAARGVVLDLDKHCTGEIHADQDAG